MKLSIEFSQKKGYTVQTHGFKVTAADSKTAVDKLVALFREEVLKCFGINE